MGFTFILPVSGGFMPAQLQLLTSLLEAGARPAACVGASGGNCAAYAGLIARWDARNMPRVVQDLCESIAIQPRSRFNALNIAVGRFVPNRGIYEETGLEQFYLRHVTDELLEDQELWTSTFNRLTNRTTLYCTAPRDRASIQPPAPERLHFCLYEPPVYGVGARQSYEVSKASASVPLLMPDVFFDGAPHTDGGVHHASAFTVLAHRLPVENRHVVFIYGYNVERVDPHRAPGAVLTEIMRTTHKLTEGHHVNDRIQALDLFAAWCPDGYDRLRQSEATVHDLHQALRRGHQAPASLLFLYPEFNRCTDLYNTAHHEVRRVMDFTRDHFMFDLFWARPPVQSASADPAGSPAPAAPAPG